ncbi:hypothetical protein SLG_28020 [Sphingobium sp. SYK-6]|uniref:EthD domain-containing protein n=1 Tax=Sphingobium sp. (strain NBRC 103272 / SYK-6) TaxID=627192 RepID=UPI0002277042|nr:EthD domain-containing protein [Sphingobium sp. SYK-6]BAK67477.1 hypothetical protein SLG_28020 [Sphingobium sp. SYK-6]
MAMIARPSQLTEEQFRIRWFGFHAALARSLPGLRTLIYSETLGAGGADQPQAAYPSRIDGMVQCAFESEDARLAALSSETGEALFTSGGRIMDRAEWRRWTVRENVVIAPDRAAGGIKRTLLLARKPGLSRANFERHWLGRHAELAHDVPGLKGAVFNTILEGDAGNGPGIDGITETWWASGSDDPGGKVPSPQADAWMADGEHFLDLPRCRTIVTIEYPFILPDRSAG